MSETSASGSGSSTQTTDTSAANPNPQTSSDVPDDKQAVSSDDAKSPWDVVKDIDWGEQLDHLKASVGGDKDADASSSSSSKS